MKTNPLFALALAAGLTGVVLCCVVFFASTPERHGEQTAGQNVAATNNSFGVNPANFDFALMNAYGLQGVVLTNYQHLFALHLPRSNPDVQLALEYWAKADFSNALQAVEQAMAAGGDLGMSLIIRGLLRGEIQRFHDAIADIDQALPLIPVEVLTKSTEAYAAILGFRGYCFLRTGDHEGAIRDLTRAIEMAPERMAFYRFRGMACSKQSAYRDALDDLSKVLAAFPDDYASLNARGTVYLRSGDVEKALLDYTAAIGIAPHLFELWMNRGMAYCEAVNWEQALSDLTESLRHNDTNSQAYVFRAYAHLMKSNTALAIQDYSAAIHISPEDARLYHDRAVAHLEATDWGSALPDFQTALRLNEGDAEVLNELSWLRATCHRDDLRNGKEAVKLATKACEVSNWGAWRYIDTLAAAYAESGDFAAASKFQKQAIDLYGKRDSEWEEMVGRLELFGRRQPYRDGGNSKKQP